MSVRAVRPLGPDPGHRGLTVITGGRQSARRVGLVRAIADELEAGADPERIFVAGPGSRRILEDARAELERRRRIA